MDQYYLFITGHKEISKLSLLSLSVNWKKQFLDNIYMIKEKVLLLKMEGK